MSQVETKPDSKCYINFARNQSNWNNSSTTSLLSVWWAHTISSTAGTKNCGQKWLQFLLLFLTSDTNIFIQEETTLVTCRKPWDYHRSPCISLPFLWGLFVTSLLCCKLSTNKVDIIYILLYTRQNCGKNLAIFWILSFGLNRKKPLFKIVIQPILLNYHVVGPLD